MPSTRTEIMVEKILEAKISRLAGHLRVSYKPRSRTLIYHIEQGAGLKMNIEIGKAFLNNPTEIAHRLDRIADGCIQMYDGMRLSSAIHLEEKEQVS